MRLWYVPRVGPDKPLRAVKVRNPTVATRIDLVSLNEGGVVTGACVNGAVGSRRAARTGRIINRFREGIGRLELQSVRHVPDEDYLQRVICRLRVGSVQREESV